MNNGRVLNEKIEEANYVRLMNVDYRGV